MFFFTLSQSCGPSREEIAAELRRSEAIADSINAENQREAERQALLKQELIELKANLAGAQAKLNSINEFKLLRTQDEKAEQVADQTRIIEELNSKIEEVQTQIK